MIVWYVITSIFYLLQSQLRFSNTALASRGHSFLAKQPLSDLVTMYHPLLMLSSTLFMAAYGPHHCHRRRSSLLSSSMTFADGPCQGHRTLSVFDHGSRSHDGLAIGLSLHRRSSARVSTMDLHFDSHIRVQSPL